MLVAAEPVEEVLNGKTVWEGGRRLALLRYVYFLDLKNGDIYVGSTNDLRWRFTSHRQGKVASTSANLPATLRSCVAVADEETARRLGGSAWTAGWSG